MRRFALGPVVTVLLVAAGCGSSGATSGDAGSSSANGLPQGSEKVALDPANFSVTIDNRYWPMEPGTRWTYDETDEEGNHSKVVVTVTNQTKKMANGITARTVRDTATQDGMIVEDTLDWYAQDEHGNLWYLGENTAEFDHGRVTSREGSWEAGVHNAQAGIALPADPADGMRYRQEYDKDNAEDSGEVLSVNEQAETPAGHYTDALLTKDTTPLEPKLLEYKLYAPGIGPVLTVTVSGGSGREQLLTKETVDAATARAAATAPLGQASR
jgi:hypothetical protein